MPTAITVKKIIRTSDGLLEALEAAASAMEFANTGAQFLYVDNQNASSCVITVTTPNQVDGNDIADLVLTLLTTEKRLMGPFPTGTYNDSDGLVQLALSVTANVDVQVYQIGG